MNQKILLGIVMTVFVGCGCGSQSGDGSDKKDPESAELIQIGGGAGVKIDPSSIKMAGIKVETVGISKLAPSTQPSGQVQPTDTGAIQITSRLPGKITEALVSVGDLVHRGQPIAYVDSVDLTTAESTYQTAVSHETLSKHQLEQQRKLAGYGALSEQAVEDARKAEAAAVATVASDEAQLKVDRLALSSTQKLVDMGEITRKPVDDAQNAYSLAQATAIQARVTLNSTKKNLDRTKILFGGGIFSKQQLEDAETAYNTAVAADDQAVVAERLAQDELTRQKTIFNQNLNGATSLQGAQSKLQQDEKGYVSDLTAVSLARTEYQRALTVRNSGIPVNSVLQQAQDTYDEAVVNVEGAANTLKLYGVTPGAPFGEVRNGKVVVPVTSPMDGIVSVRTMVVGQVIDPTVELVRLVNLNDVTVDAQVYEKDLQGVAAGDSVAVKVPAFPNDTFYGKVKWVSSEISPDTRTATVRTVLKNPGWKLRPGMYAGIVIGSQKSKSIVSVPAEAVLQDGDKDIAYVQVGDGQFIRREVKVGDMVNGRIPVERGLSPGDQVAVSGNIYLQKAQEQLETEKAGSK